MTTVVTNHSGAESKTHLRVLLAGRPGAGLSSSAATWPDPYYLLFGGSLSWVDADLAYARITTIDELMTALTALGSEEDRAAHFGVRVATVVIDTIDGLAHLVGDDPRKMRGLLEVITNLPLHVVLLAHVRATSMTLLGERMEPAVCIAEEVATYVDMALYVGVAEQTFERYVRARPTSEVPWVMDRSGQLAAVTPIGEAGFAQLAEAAGLSGETAPGPAKQAPKAAAPPPPPQRVPPAPAHVEPDTGDDDGEGTNDEQPDDSESDLPMCESQGAQGNDCLGRVESQDSLDLSRVRFNRPMCGPCGKAEYEAMPKVLPRKARPAPAKAAAPPPPPPPPPRSPGPASEAAAVVPRGEVVGRIPPPSDRALRDLLAE